MLVKSESPHINPRNFEKSSKVLSQGYLKSIKIQQLSPEKSTTWQHNASYSIQNKKKRQMEQMGKTITLIALLTLATALHIELDYINQQNWPGDCVTGRAQSPINIPHFSDLDSRQCPDFTFRIASPRSTISVLPYEDSNHYLLIPYTGSTITTKNKQTNVQTVYKSLQFHFHISSQHQIDGEAYDAELHLVHATPEKNLAVFGILIEVGEGYFPDFLDGWTMGSSRQSQITLPEIYTPSHVYHYKGSLTTPNCGEGVQWFVSSKPLRVKRSNFNRLSRVLNGGKRSNRNVQNLNGRQIMDVGRGCIARSEQE